MRGVLNISSSLRLLSLCLNYRGHLETYAESARRVPQLWVLELLETMNFSELQSRHLRNLCLTVTRQRPRISQANKFPIAPKFVHVPSFVGSVRVSGSGFRVYAVIGPTFCFEESTGILVLGPFGNLKTH